MHEKQAAMRLESAIDSALSESAEQRLVDEDLLGRVQVAESLAALDLVGESRVRESLREQLQHAMKERRVRATKALVRRPWVARRPLLATELALLLVLGALAVAAPRSLAALVEPVARVIERVRVGEGTQILRQAPLSEGDAVIIWERYRRQLGKGESWYQATPYGGFGGAVPIGERATVRRVSHLANLHAATKQLQIPTGVHRGEPVRFDHALLAPGGVALMFFGSGANEVFLSAFPVGDGGSVSYSRGVSRRASDGQLGLESPELKPETISVGGQQVVWDPDPAPPAPKVNWPLTWLFRRQETSALRWEEDGVSYSLMGRSLTREEAVDLFLSRRPIDEAE